MLELIPFIMFLTVCLVLLAGYPVAFSLAGTAIVFALFGTLGGVFDLVFASIAQSPVWHYGKYHVDCGTPVCIYGDYVGEVAPSRRFAE